ncbi:MAG: hypothetical protein IT460_12570 [Planctomycetes bacterium]|nr:hypothetical protein [Planctomycetota bacterium]
MTEPSAAAPSPGPAPARAPGKAPPGSKRARHYRWVRIAAATTVVALVGFAAWMALAFRGDDSPYTSQEAGCLGFLDGIAKQVRGFSERKGRLPTTLAELRDPESPSPYDAEPWDCWQKPIEYQIVDADRRRFRLRSYGPDVKPDTADDLLWPAGEPWR